MVSEDSSVVAASEPTYSELDGEAVILNLKFGVDYNLNAKEVNKKNRFGFQPLQQQPD